MKRSNLYLALSLLLAGNAMAGDLSNPNSQITSSAEQNRSVLVVGVTESGQAAADTAWLLSKQAQDNQRYTPILVVLKPETRISTLNSLNLRTTELPAVLFLDSNGKEINRVVGTAPAGKVFQKSGVNTVSMN